jgi:hypothetical protein
LESDQALDQACSPAIAMGDAIAFLDAVVEAPGVELGLRGGEWPALRNTLLRLGLHGNLVSDAWIAAAVQPFPSVWSLLIETLFDYCLHAM